MFLRKTIPPSVLANYSIIPFTEEYSTEWDDFVENKSINGTFLHSRKFYNHHAQNRLDDNSFLFYKRKKLLVLLDAFFNLNIPF